MRRARKGKTIRTCIYSRSSRLRNYRMRIDDPASLRCRETAIVTDNERGYSRVHDHRYRYRYRSRTDVLESISSWIGVPLIDHSSTFIRRSGRFQRIVWKVAQNRIT